MPDANAAMKDSQLIRVLLVDDHEIVRRGLAVFLEGFDDMELVGQAENGEEALERYRELEPDVVLMDLVMPTMDGPTAIRTLRAEYPKAKVVALTTFRDKELVHQTLQAGAVGYLYKDASVDELADAIRRAYAGNTVMLSSQAAEALLDLIHEGEQADQSPRGELTARELEVLALLVEGLTNRQIAYRLHVSESTAKQYVRGILSKLQVSSRTEAVAMAVQNNLLQDM
ncbi:MAG: response regulator [Caldilineaceae bacterium]|jgi:NarL family two-component system response regulator LiaR